MYAADYSTKILQILSKLFQFNSYNIFFNRYLYIVEID